MNQVIDFHPVLQATAQHLGIRASELIGLSNGPHVSRCRYMAVLMLRESGLSVADAAAALHRVAGNIVLQTSKARRLEAAGGDFADRLNHLRAQMGVTQASTARCREQIPQLLAAVCKLYGVDPTDLLGASRKAMLIEPRHVLMYLLREDFALEFTEIGQKLGERHHTSAMHAVKQIGDALNKGDELLAGRIKLLRVAMRGGK